MRIIAAVDTKSYSDEIMDYVARLAANTWSDLTLLGIQSGNTKVEENLIQAIVRYRNTIFEHEEDAGLYAPVSMTELKETAKGRWEVSSRARKEFSVVIRGGDARKEILAEIAERNADLVILGCTKGIDCIWEGEAYLPQKIARDAPCSVLVIKSARKPDQIVAFLDQTNVSQESLEMINQMVTVNNAGLKIVGLKTPKGVKGDVEKKMVEILKYYNEREIGAWIKLVDIENLEEYVAQSTREGMVALWMGKESILSKIFSRGLIEKLISNTQSSVLLLR